jgi:uncharacterized membrane protein YfcA
VHLLALIFLAPVSIITARFSARLAHRVSPLWLKRLFAVALFGVGARFLWVLVEKG